MNNKIEQILIDEPTDLIYTIRTERGELILVHLDKVSNKTTYKELK